MYGGLLTIRSNVCPATGTNRSPSTNVIRSRDPVPDRVLRSPRPERAALTVDGGHLHRLVLLRRALTAMQPDPVPRSSTRGDVHAAESPQGLHDQRFRLRSRDQDGGRDVRTVGNRTRDTRPGRRPAFLRPACGSSPGRRALGSSGGSSSCRTYRSIFWHPRAWASRICASSRGRLDPFVCAGSPRSIPAAGGPSMSRLP